MNIKKREARDIKIINYLCEDNTYFDTAIHFDLSVNQIFRINRKIKLKILDKIAEGLSIEAVAEQVGVPLGYVSLTLEEFHKGKLTNNVKADREAMINGA